MNANLNNTSLKLVTEQTTNNTTSWVGHTKDNKEITTGQTFTATSEGDLQSIEVFSNLVSKPGNVTMTVHTFDPEQKKWGASLGTSNVEFKQSDSGKWIAFNIPSLHLDKGKVYGFKLGSHDCFMGVGEAVGSAKNPPFTDGQEWKFMDSNGKGDAFSYFSLAFKIGLRA